MWRGGPREMTRGEILERTIEALLFLSPEPVPVADLAEACDVTEAEVDRALDASAPRSPRASAGWSCATWRGATRSRPTRSPSPRPVACWRSPERRRSPRRRPRRSRSSPTSSRSRGRRWRGSAASTRVGDTDPVRARPDRGVRALAVRRRRLSHDRAVRAPLRARRARPAARSVALRPHARGRARAARAPAEGRRGARGVALPRRR